MTDEQRKEARKRLKAHLGEYRFLEAERLQLLDEITKLEARRTAPGTSNWDAMPRGGGGGGSNVMDSGLIQQEGLLERYQRKVANLEVVQTWIEMMIDSLEPAERKLMRHRYIEGLTWENVCVAMNYSWRQTHNIHGQALDKLVEAEKE